MNDTIQRRRVVITGMGVISPVGSTVDTFWTSLKQGRSGIGPITQCEANDIASQIAGEVKDFDPLFWLEDKKDIRKTDRFMQMGIAASKMAVDDAKLVIDEHNAHSIGVLIGSGIGGLTALCNQHSILLEKGPRRVSPFLIPMVIANLASGQVSIRLGAKGPNSAVTTACAAGGHAIGDAFRHIQRGDALCMIAGGAEACINRVAVSGFSSMKALSTRNNEPEKASRPFDRDRDGFVVAEGSGIVVLEDLEYALKRGAPQIYGELVGYGMSGDAYHISAPPPDGDGASRCMNLAMRDAGIKPDQVDYINAHGTSTPYNDRTETYAIKSSFGDHAYSLKISSTKSMTGHLLGGAGGIETVASLLVIRDGIIPPTMNLDNRDPECDLDFVPNQAITYPVEIAMSNSFGFGGTNASLVFKKYVPGRLF